MSNIPTNKKKFFKEKIKSVKCKLWDQEFALYKQKENREEMRMDYDNKKAHILLLEDKYKKAKKEGKLNKDDLARIDDDKVRGEAALKDIEGYMKEADIGMYGCKPCPEHPEGFNGQQQLIEGLRSLLEMYNEYLKKEV